MRTSAERRKNDYNKALRKKNIAEHNYGFAYYDNVHQYSKNKIHRSCPLCTAKTDMNSKNNIKISDKKKIESMKSKEEDFNR